jgi:hypothetical protein
LGPQEPLRFEHRKSQTTMVSKTGSKNQTIGGFAAFGALYALDQTKGRRSFSTTN